MSLDYSLPSPMRRSDTSFTVGRLLVSQRSSVQRHLLGQDRSQHASPTAQTVLNPSSWLAKQPDYASHPIASNGCLIGVGVMSTSGKRTAEEASSSFGPMQKKAKAGSVQVSTSSLQDNYTLGQDAPAEDGKSASTAYAVDDSDDERDIILVSNDALMMMKCQPVPPELDNASWCGVSEIEAAFDEQNGHLTNGTHYPDAFLLIERCNNMVKEYTAPSTYMAQTLLDFVKLIGMKDGILMTERLLETQSVFFQQGKPCRVDVGYHYTQEKNLDRIQTDGLLSKGERDERGIVAKFNGSVYGDGIYTGSNPTDHFGRYGNVGLIVLRLKGIENTRRHHYGLGVSEDHDTTVDSMDPSQQRIVVLKDSAQCVPIFQFDASMIRRRDPTCHAIDTLKNLHNALQELVDSSLNAKVNEDPIKTLEPLPVHLIDPSSGVAPARLGRIDYTAPTCTKELLAQSMYTIVGPFPCWVDCSVCRERLGTETRPTAQLFPCGHWVHVDCLIKALSYRARCPCCRVALEESSPAWGCMPSGRMEVTRDSFQTCPGHCWGTLIIKYTFPGGIQSEFHPNPGTPYDGTTRMAYLPDTSEGRIVLSRLQASFRLGLNFNIGTSMSTKQSNVITWSSIPHKSKLRGGKHAFGYPDADYFANCHAALDALQVKPASSDELLLN